VLNVVPDGSPFEFEFCAMPGEDRDAMVAEIAADTQDMLK
jgi:hypothetical protein